MKAHVIVDPNRPPGNWTLYNELTRENVEHEFVCAIEDAHSVVRSINMSHKQIVQRAKDEGLPEICIMEEDIMFTAPGAWQYFLDNKPAEFDLYLGGAYGLNELAYKRISENPGSCEIHNFAGLHCYIIRATYYDKFLSIPSDSHIDNQPGMGRFFVCSPFAVLQTPGWSSNNRGIVDYNVSLKPEYIYHGVPKQK